MELPNPTYIKRFVEALEGTQAHEIQERLSEFKPENATISAILIAAAAIHFDKHYEVWTGFSNGTKHVWVKYEGSNIDPFKPSKPMSMASPSSQTQKKVREFILKSFKEARPQKRVASSAVLKSKGWVAVSTVRSAVISKLLKSCPDLAAEVVATKPSNKPGYIEKLKDLITLTYDDYTIHFSAVDDKPMALLLVNGEEVETAYGHGQVYEFMGTYVHPADRATAWNMLGDYFGVGRD